MIFERTLYGFVCADCEPEDEAYFVAVSTQPSNPDWGGPLEICPRCGGHLSFVQDGAWEAKSAVLLSWQAKQETKGE